MSVLWKLMPTSETIVEKHDILEWRQQNKFKFPNIYQLVKKYLCIPATSCPSGRVFSKSGEILVKNARNYHKNM